MGFKEPQTIEEDLELIKASTGNATYTINIINVDNGKTENVNIQIIDATTDDALVDVNSLID